MIAIFRKFIAYSYTKIPIFSTIIEDTLSVVAIVHGLMFT